MFGRTASENETEIKPQASAGNGIASFEEAYERLMSERPGILASESGGELAWLKTARERDSIRWRAEGMPSRRQEEWKYTSVAPIAEATVKLPTALDMRALPPRSEFPTLPLKASAEIVFLNGQYVAQWSKTAADTGLSVMVLSDLVNQCVEEGWSADRLRKMAAFREHVESSDADRETIFAAMNTSFLQDAVLIHADPGTVIAHPVVVYYYSDNAGDGAEGTLQVASPRVFMTLDARSEMALVEVYAGRDGRKYFSNAVSDVRVSQGARLSYSKVQLEGSDAYHIGTTRVRQQRDSWTEVFQFSFGAKLSRQDLHVSLEGEGAEAVVDGLYMVQGRLHADNHTAIEHVVPHTTSGQVYKGILDDESRAVFNGRVWIHKDAQKSNAAQLNNNLVLSSKAEVDTKPELEIYADDVKAAHGATIGQMDPEHLFYLQTRAIPRSVGVRMLAQGFAQEVVYKIKHDEVRAGLEGLVANRFASMKV